MVVKTLTLRPWNKPVRCSFPLPSLPRSFSHPPLPSYNFMFSCTLSQRRKSTKRQTYRVHFMLANYSWLWGLPWCVADVPSNTPLEKTGFPFSAAVYCTSLLGWTSPLWGSLQTTSTSRQEEARTKRGKKEVWLSMTQWTVFTQTSGVWRRGVYFRHI